MLRRFRGSIETTSIHSTVVLATYRFKRDTSGEAWFYFLALIFITLNNIAVSMSHADRFVDFVVAWLGMRIKLNDLYSFWNVLYFNILFVWAVVIGLWPYILCGNVKGLGMWSFQEIIFILCYLNIGFNTYRLILKCLCQTCSLHVKWIVRLLFFVAVKCNYAMNLI